MMMSDRDNDDDDVGFRHIAGFNTVSHADPSMNFQQDYRSHL